MIISIIIYYLLVFCIPSRRTFIEVCSKRTLIYESNAKIDSQPLRYGPRHDGYPFFFLMDFINVYPN